MGARVMIINDNPCASAFRRKLVMVINRSDRFTSWRWLNDDTLGALYNICTEKEKESETEILHV